MRGKRIKNNGGYVGKSNVYNMTGSLSSSNYYDKHARVPEWYRPSDWLAMPDLTGITHMFTGLFAVYNGASGNTGTTADSNFVTLLCRGAYIVDWGNGTTQAYADNTVARNNYNFADIPSTTQTTQGYRQVIIKAYPQAGSRLTQVSLNQKYGITGATLQNRYNHPWLSIKIAGVSLSTYNIGSNAPTTGVDMLEEFEFVGPSSITSLADMFQQATRVQCIKGTEFTSRVTISNSTHTTAVSLTKLPLYDFRNNAAPYSLAQSCSSLEIIPPFDFSKATNLISSMFTGTAIKSVPPLHFGTGRSFNSCFQNCYALKNIEGISAAPKTLANSFYLCTNITKLPPNLDTSGATQFNGMFEGSYSLNDVSGLCTAAGRDFGRFMVGGNRLNLIDNLTFSEGNTFTQAFQSCVIRKYKMQLNNAKTLQAMFYGSHVSRIDIDNGATGFTSSGVSFGWYNPAAGVNWLQEATALKVLTGLTGNVYNVDMRQQLFSPSMLDQIFTSLGSTAGILNVSQNWGASGASYGIAIAKGWTFTNA